MLVSAMANTVYTSACIGRFSKLSPLSASHDFVTTVSAFGFLVIGFLVIGFLMNFKTLYQLFHCALAFFRLQLAVLFCLQFDTALLPAVWHGLPVWHCSFVCCLTLLFHLLFGTALLGFVTSSMISAVVLVPVLFVSVFVRITLW